MPLHGLLVDDTGIGPERERKEVFLWEEIYP